MQADPTAVAVLVRERSELFHVVCCDDNDTALCGTDASHLPFTEEHEPFCVVCAEMEQLDLCPRTGTVCHYADSDEWECRAIGGSPMPTTPPQSEQ